MLCLHDLPRSGRPVEIDGEQRAKITALACSDPPEGYARWSIRLLADKAVELEYCEHISHTTVRKILKKRTEAAFEAHLVHWHLGQSLFSTDGAPLGALRTAVRPGLSGGVF